MMLTLSRPARVLSCPVRLEEEYRSARWIHHRLLDFEDEHQRIVDEAAERCAPGIRRVGRILARLKRREKRRKRTTTGQWSPHPRPELTTKLQAMLVELRERRNADPRWKAALGWADDPIGSPKQVRRRRAKSPDKVKRRKRESDEAWAKRFARLTSDETEEHFAEKKAKAPRRTRREEYRAKLYAERRIYWGTWNALCKSVDQAVAKVLQLRKQGMPAEWRRRRFGNRGTIAADPGGFRICERGDLWWVVEMRLGTESGKGPDAEWVRVRAKCGNWHHVPDDASITTARLTQRRDGQRWNYTLSLTVDGAGKSRHAATASRTGRVAFDWGHREHGHDTSADGIRAFVWLGDDGRSGEVLVPAECRRCLDEINEIKSRCDELFDARKRSLGLRDKNRHTYRKRLLRSGVRTEEESDWLRWDTRKSRMIARRWKRVKNLRRETYTKAVRELRRHYAEFVFEDECVHDPERKRTSIRETQTKEQIIRRRRSNRDLCARHEFVSLCERFGAELHTVSARNTTRECPECGHLDENTAELLMACSACGTVRDKDFGAAAVILRRSYGPLADKAAE